MNFKTTYMNDFERAKKLQNIIISRATGGREYDEEYIKLRNYFEQDISLWELMPSFVRINSDLQQFWMFIKNEFPSYHERRTYINDGFQDIFVRLDKNKNSPADPEINNVLFAFDQDEVFSIWQKALDRRYNDPSGAITASKTLIESICKQILDKKNIIYERSINTYALYKKTAECLNLSPNQYSEKIFRNILGSCSNIVNSLSNIRNQLGDAHGQGVVSPQPAPRHAALAVNLAGAMAMFGNYIE